MGVDAQITTHVTTCPTTLHMRVNSFLVKREGMNATKSIALPEVTWCMMLVLCISVYAVMFCLAYKVNFL